MIPSRFPTFPLAWLLLALSAVGFIWLGALRQSLANVIGDEGTFMAMAESFAEDGDLRFDERDEQRLRQKRKGGRWVLILQQTERGVFYSKPAPFAIMAAPFYRLFGEAGLVLFNAVALALALLLAFLFARRLGSGGRAALTVATFAGASCILGYVAWRISDSLQLSLSLAGLVLAVTPLVPPSPISAGRLDRWLASPWAVGLGALLLGVVAVMRYPNALLGVGAATAWLSHRRWRQGLGVLAIFMLSLAAGTAVNWLTTGAAVPYKASRTSFNLETGYPTEPAAEASQYFAARPATQTMGVKPRFEPSATLYSSLYFFVGRHTGLLLHFPAALVLLGTALRYPQRRSWLILAAGLGMAVFYLVWMPRNYFGGEGFIGNRYFLSSYAAWFVALPRLPGRRWLAVTWVLALTAFASALVSVQSTRDRDMTSQNHTYAGVFRLLPYESTAAAIDGRRDRYWSDEFVRFVDPFAEVGRLDFRLQSAEPAAEIQAVNERQAGVMRFLVNTDVPRAILDYRDWRSRRSFELFAETEGANARGVIEVLPSPTWRKHSFWFKRDELFRVRNFRLALRSPDGNPASAEVHYLGRYHPPFRIYDAEVLELVLPEAAVAGSRSEIAVRIRNASRQPWNSDRVLPVYLGYELWPVGGGPTIDGARTRLAEPVEPGAEVACTMTILWPLAAGEYELNVDLRIEGLGWFRERRGEPLSSGIVSVRPQEEGD